MNEKDFLKGLIEFDRDNIPNEIIAKIRKQFINDPDFKPSRVKEASVAAEGLCLWVRALDEYDKVNKFVIPKKIQAREAEQQYQVTMEGLLLKQNELKIIVGQFEELQNKLDETIQKKTNLENDIQECIVKL
jgi:dynein heavy chain, axonemal